MVKVVTAAALFDGHDASINIIRRVLISKGAEVVHLGHNHSAFSIVKAALQEGAHAICISSYQGGHMEFFKYVKDLLVEAGAPYVRIFGGGGGVIVYPEKKELEAYGIDQIFHPEDGMRLGLEGMIDLIIERSQFDVLKAAKESSPQPGKRGLDQDVVGELIKDRKFGLQCLEALHGSREMPSPNPHQPEQKKCLVLGITGTGGAGKSSLIDELVSRFQHFSKSVRLAVTCVDPSKKKTGGSLLGDRIRMNSLERGRVFMRSLPTGGSKTEISQSLPQLLSALSASADFDLVIAETSGIGQASAEIVELSDMSLYVMTSEYGAQSQLEKIDMIDFADFIAINKSDRRGSEDALRDVKKQYLRSRKKFEGDLSAPVYLTQAALFHDQGVNELFFAIVGELAQRDPSKPIWKEILSKRESVRGTEQASIVPKDRTQYLLQIAKAVRSYKSQVEMAAQKLNDLQSLKRAQEISGLSDLAALIQDKEAEVQGPLQMSTATYAQLKSDYEKDQFVYEVRGKRIEQPLTTTSLSGTRIPKVVVPRLDSWGDRYRYLSLENVPGQFPFTAGVFPLKRPDEDPKRMFAGEGPPERTNERFHLLCHGEPVQRLSTAFDSVTLYGENPQKRPDIFGKVGESGVSVCTLEDMKRLYKGFDLSSPKTSVSMTINGPAPMILAFFLNTAIDQAVDRYKETNGREPSKAERLEIEAQVLQTVRGTVQADILKEDQGQNTCIFSIQFALKMMGDIQEYFVRKKVLNFYSVSISGYHIAEAGANPISQLAFTLSNGFTYVEYYLARGLKIDDFAPNLSFFFSNGMDPEYSVLGRVARRIWAIAMRDVYGASERSQKLKYHIQTSGRSLHAQEIDFNDIRTTLQALLALYDQCNSLHTNAYDEAITTPTAESVRRAMAIQLILQKEFGVLKNENPTQGAYFLLELTELVEEAVLEEFVKISDRGGVLGAMETQYQRSKIQEESLLYEHLKHSGELPVIGVNTFKNPQSLEENYEPPTIEIRRASFEEKQMQLERRVEFEERHRAEATAALAELQSAALSQGNIFEALMKASKVCSLGQMTSALFEVGGQYRRNL